MAERKLTLCELNRTTLKRQLLLERSDVGVMAAVERLVGMQAQLASAPYVGLWTRLKDFQRMDLAGLIDAHKIVKATMMRATLHLSTAEDYLKLRATLQAVLAGASASIRESRGVELNIEDVLKVAREYINQEPRTFAEISTMLTEKWPEQDVGSMRYTVRTHLPLVQVPVSKGWGFPGNPQFTLAETWLNQPIPNEEDLRLLVKRYLAAFGPASVTDMQTWSGLEKLKPLFEQLRPELQVYKDEGGREVFDLPDLDVVDGDVPAPERFLPEFDNILLSHQKRTRIVADEYRKKVYLPGLRVAATILVDGFVAGAWKVERVKKAATLKIEPFTTISATSKKALTEEGERLVRWIESDATTFEVTFVE